MGTSIREDVYIKPRGQADQSEVIQPPYALHKTRTTPIEVLC